MSKIDNIIIKSIATLSSIGLLGDLAILNYLKIQKNAIIHNLEKDILIDRWWEICTSLLIVFIPFVSVSVICILMIYKRKKLSEVHYDSVKMSDADLVPTLSRTSQHHREQQTIVISDDFKDLFRPDFFKKDELGLIPFEIMTDELKKGIWSITELGRIARMCFEAEVHAPKYKHFNHWMKDFCNRIGRTDCPVKPEKKSYKVDKNSHLLKIFLCIVRIGERKYSDYTTRLSR